MAIYRALTFQPGITGVTTSHGIYVGASINTESGDLTITPAGTNVTIANAKSLIAGGTSTALDFSASTTGVFKTTLGAVTIGTGALSVTASSSSFTNVINANGDVQRSSVGTMNVATTSNTTTLNIGTNAATTTLQIGNAANTTTILGALQVNGIETIVGASTFQSPATFEGDVTIGNGVLIDTLAFNDTSATAGGRLGSAGFPDVIWTKGMAHQLYVAASTVTNETAFGFTIKSGAGNGTGAGGVLTLMSGAGGGTGVGGAVTIDTGSGTAGGAVTLGTTNAASVAIGRSAITTTVAGTVTLSAFTTNGGLVYTNASGVTAQTGAGTSTTILHGGTTPSYSAVSLTADVSGTLPVANGGTGVASTTAYGVLLGGTTTTGAFQNAGAGTAGQVLVSNGASAVPSFQTVSSGAVTVTAGATIAAGAPVGLENSGGNARAFEGEADAAGNRNEVIGIAVAGIASAATGTVTTSGEVDIPDAQTNGGAGFTAAQVGMKVYTSETPGVLTLDVSGFASGSKAQRVGYVSRGVVANVSKIVIHIGDAVTI